jgi:hypothetical protein
MSLQRPRFDLRLIHVGFVVDRVTLSQIFLKVLELCFTSIILSVLHTH